MRIFRYSNRIKDKGYTKAKITVLYKYGRRTKKEMNRRGKENKKKSQHFYLYIDMIFTFPSVLDLTVLYPLTSRSPFGVNAGKVSVLSISSGKRAFLVMVIWMGVIR